MDMLGIVPAESGDFSEDDEPQILQIRWNGETYPMYFQAGPTFELTENSEDVQVFAYYDDGQIVGLMSLYGSGNVRKFCLHLLALSWNTML